MVEQERRGEGGWGLFRGKGREGKARRVFWVWGHRCTGQIPYGLACCSPGLGVTWRPLASGQVSRFPSAVKMNGFYAIYTVSSDGCYRRSLKSAGVTFTSYTARTALWLLLEA